MMLAVTMTRSVFLGTLWLWSTSTLTLTSVDVTTDRPSDRSNHNTQMKPPPIVSKQHDSERNWNTATQTQAQAQYTRGLLQDRLREDPTLAGPLLRLAFHDATTFESLSSVGVGSSSSSIRRNNNSENGGGDGKSSAVIAGTGGPNGSVRYELEWSENRGLSRPLAVVDSIFQQQQQQQQGPQASASRLSFADIAALAGAVAIESAGGPLVPIQLGRIDAAVADARTLAHPVGGMAASARSRSNVTATMPSAAFDSDGLRLYFQRLGLTEREWVALSGTHGLGRHVSLLGMLKPCLRNLTRQCLEDAPVLLPFVAQSVDTVGLGNSYFKALLQWYNRDTQQVGAFSSAFLPTDVAMVVDEGLRKHVRYFSLDRNLPVYYKTLARAYQKLTESTATTVDRY